MLSYIIGAFLLVHGLRRLFMVRFSVSDSEISANCVTSTEDLMSIASDSRRGQEITIVYLPVSSHLDSERLVSSDAMVGPLRNLYLVE